jgi:hypothetical protein
METDRAKEVAREYFERHPRDHDLTTIDRLLAADYVVPDAPAGTPPAHMSM